MDSSFWFDKNKWDSPLYMSRGVRLKPKKCILLSEYLFTFTNSVDPDEMQHYAALHLGLHCLQKTHLGVSRLQIVNCNMFFGCSLRWFF